METMQNLVSIKFLNIKKKRVTMDKDKIKQFVALVGGFLGSLYLALNTSGISAEWINPQKVDAWVNVLNTGIPIALTFYGVYKNTFILTDKAKKQEEMLKQKDMK